MDCGRKYIKEMCLMWERKYIKRYMFVAGGRYIKDICLLGAKDI